MSKHLIVISVDALVYEDLEYAQTLPSFKHLMENGSIIKRIKTVYPSETHPAHATIITGVPTGDTGIVNNHLCDLSSPQKVCPFYNYLHEIKVETILHAAHRAGLSTATSSWPMTSGGNDVIDYLVPNAMNSDFVGFENNVLDAYRRLGAQECVIDVIAEGVKRYGYQNRHPEMDDFQAYCSAEIIKRFKPNLLLTHPGDVDDSRHAGGVFSDRVTSSIEKTDRWIGMLLDAVKEAGIEAETDIIVLGDHGQINVTRTVYPNVFLAKKGLISISEDGNVSSWKAFVKSAGGSAQVYLSDKDDKAIYDKTYELLLDMANEGLYGFERVYTVAETKALYGLYGDFSFVLETDGYTSFGENVTLPAVKSINFDNYRYGKGTHGYAPEKGPQTTFIACGPSFKKGTTVERGDILNHAPTFAKALGIDFPHAKGKSVTEILR